MRKSTRNDLLRFKVGLSELQSTTTVLHDCNLHLMMKILHMQLCFGGIVNLRENGYW